MNQEDIIKMAREASVPNSWDLNWFDPYYARFAALVAAAEREKVAQWMIERGYATGHGDTIEDLLAELDWQIAENWTQAMVKGVETEREACAKLCLETEPFYGVMFANAIRERGQS